MEKQTNINKQAVKKIINIFILTVIVLTFFSKTINNLMLPSVKIAQPKSGSLFREIEGQGKVEAKEIYNHYIDLCVKVADIKVKEGETVKKGDLIMKLDKKSISKELDKNLVMKEKVQYNIESLELKINNLLENNKFNLQVISDDIDTKKTELNNKEKLYMVGSEAKNNIDILKEAIRQKQTEYDRCNIENKQQIEELKLDITKSELEIKEYDKAIDELKFNLSISDNIYSPYDGIIDKINYSVGCTTQTDKPLYSLKNISKGFIVKAYVNNEMSEYLSIEDKVKVNIISLGNKQIEGVIKNIKNSYNVDNSKELLIEINDKDFNKLKGNEKVNIRVSKKSKNYDVIISNSAIRRNNNETYVLVLKASKGLLGEEYYADKALIYMDGQDNSNTVVTDGLYDWDKVIISSSRPIEIGDKVKIES